MIEFAVNGRRWSELAVALRIAVIIGEVDAYHDRDSGRCPYQKDNGSWQLDSGNDWFLRKTGENLYELSYRYNMIACPERQAAFDGLKLFLEVIVFT